MLECPLPMEVSASAHMVANHICVCVHQLLEHLAAEASKYSDKNES